jgi:hypothetical protein
VAGQGEMDERAEVVPGPAGREVTILKIVDSLLI